MGLLRMALIFGAGYALGRPEGRHKIAELAQRPEVKQAREQAVSTVSSGLETGKQRLSGKVSSAKDKNRGPSFPESGARPDGGPSVTAADLPPTSGSPSGTASNASSLGTTSPGTTSPGRSASTPASPSPTSPSPTSPSPTSPSQTSPSPTSTGTSSGTPSTGGRSTGTGSAGTSGTKPSGTTASGTGSTEPDLPSTPPSTAR
jgi:hypothetical protein